LTKAAFAVMIKFSDLVEDFDSMVDLIAMDAPSMSDKEVMEMIKDLP
jgi:hypothetical protein